MVLRTALILGLFGLAVGVWVGTWLDVQAKSSAEREWHRVTGTINGLSNPLRPDVKVEQGIEFLPPRAVWDGPDERGLEMERDEGLRRFRRYEFLVDPVTKRARVAGVRFSPILLSLLGLVYLGLAAAFHYVTSNHLPYPGGTLPASPGGEFGSCQAPPWHEPAIIAARFGAWETLKWALGAGILVFGVVIQLTSRTGTLLSRVGLNSVALLAAGVLSVMALDRATYRIEADSTGLRESSATLWKMTRWPVLRGAIDETAYHYLGGTPSGRGSSRREYVAHRVYFTDNQGEEVVSIGDDLVTEQGKALLAYVLGHTGLKPEKRVRGKK